MKTCAFESPAVELRAEAHAAAAARAACRGPSRARGAELRRAQGSHVPVVPLLLAARPCLWAIISDQWAGSASAGQVLIMR
jgi:hypothetical protein